MDRFIATLIILVAGGLPIVVGGALVVGLFFRREFAAVLRARRLGTALESFACQRCGACCRLTVLADRPTLAVMERILGKPRQEFSRSCLFFWGILKRGADGACVLRTQTDSEGAVTYACSVYAVRPWACRRFPRPVFLGRVPGADARCPHIRELD